MSGSEGGREARAGGGDDGLAPEVRAAVAALRQLPPAAPGAAARAAAAAAADRRWSARLPRARPRRGAAGLAGPWRRGALAAAGVVVAAALGTSLFGTFPLGTSPLGTSPLGTRASGPPALGAPAPGARRGPAPGGPVPILPAVGGAADEADAPRPVAFTLRRPDARAVAVVGDFNGWDARATPLARGAGGGWAATVPLAPGRHAYRFVVDGAARVLDPAAPAERDPELGVARSIVVVGAP